MKRSAKGNRFPPLVFENLQRVNNKASQ